eukprot:3683199-Pyramimonas_sp.AAC.4
MPLSHLLNNNAEGRYRLQMEVWITSQFDASSGNFRQKAPVATQVPVLPVLRSSFDDRRLFQIPAFDYNQEDYLVFRYGDLNEQGGITRSKMERYPQLVPPPEGVSYAGYAQYGDLHCSTKSNTYISEGCCSKDRVPHSIWGTSEFSFTSDVPGLVEWHTFYDETNDGQWPYAKDAPLPVGLYNMVVMIADTVLLFPGDDGYDASKVDPNCPETFCPHQDDAALAPYIAMDPNRKVFDNRYKTSFNYKSLVPLDYMLYLYSGPVGFCNKGCKDNKPWDLEASLNGESNAAADWESIAAPPYPGAATFADEDGVYGLEYLDAQGEGVSRADYLDLVNQGLITYPLSAATWQTGGKWRYAIIITAIVLNKRQSE